MMTVITTMTPMAMASPHMFMTVSSLSSAARGQTANGRRWETTFAYLNHAPADRMKTVPREHGPMWAKLFMAEGIERG